MKYPLVAALVCACTLPAQPKPGSGSIEGHVLHSVTGAPIRKANVILQAPQIHLVADTDAEGRFEFTGLPPGSYRITANRPGFLDRPARRPISLGTDEHAANAEVRLPPYGVIAGRVLDEDGDPSDARVSVFKQIYRDGRKQWERLNTVVPAGDTGEYRYPSLTPGRYLVQAFSQRPGVENRYGERELPDKPRLSYVPTYYPSAPDLEAASPVQLGVGAEARGIDIRLAKVAVPPRFHVKGRVTGIAQSSKLTVAVSLVPADAGTYRGSAMVQSPDYGFDVSVPSGRYTSFAHVYSGGPEAYATGTLTVTGNLTDFVIALSPPPELAGRIVLAEPAGKANLQGIAVMLNRILTLGSLPDARSDASGKLTFSEPIPPGRYSMDLRAIPENCFVQKVKLAGQEISPDDFEILASAPLEIVLAATAGRIAGMVVDEDGKPFPIASVTLIPADGKTRPTKLRPSDDGNFQFASLRPGAYQLFAWEDVDDALWQDPEFRKPFEKRAVEVTVESSETKTVEVRVIASDQIK